MTRRDVFRTTLLGAAALFACLALGCASDLIVAAPDSLPPTDPAALGRLAPLNISVGEVTNAPPITESLGTRAAAPLQPGGPIHLTEDAGGIVQRTVHATLRRAGHRVVSEAGEAHVALNVREFVIDAPRAGFGWEVVVRVRLTARVSAALGDDSWDEISATAERTLRTAWRPGVGTVEPVLQECLEDLSSLLARRPEFAAALAKHAVGGSAG